jgi:hypothetical protein
MKITNKSNMGIFLGRYIHRVIVGFVTEDTLPMLSSMLLFEGNIERIRVLHNF